MSTTAALSPDRTRWVESVAGAPIDRARRELTGGSRELWFVTLGGPADGQEVVLRIDSGEGAFTDSPYSLAREAEVYRALAGTAVPVPRLLGASDDALLLERVPGTSRLADLTATEAASVLADLMTALGALHQLDAAALHLPGFGQPGDLATAVRDEIGTWRELASRSTRPPDPLTAYAVSWLTARCPDGGAAPVLVQGDTGPGNLVAHRGRLLALVDWELSHLSHPMDDIAWIDMRCQGLPGAFGDVALRDRCYHSASGMPVDPDLVAYFAVFVRLRCLVTTDLTLARGGGKLGLAAYAPPHHRFREELALALLSADRVVPLDAALDLDEGATPLSTLDEHAIRGLTDVVLPACSGGEAKLRARAAMLTLEHHRRLERFGRGVERAEAADRRATLGRTVDDAELVSLAAAAGTSGDTELLGLLFRGAQRGRLLWTDPAASSAAGAPPIGRIR